MGSSANWTMPPRDLRSLEILRGGELRWAKVSALHLGSDLHLGEESANEVDRAGRWGRFALDLPASATAPAARVGVEQLIWVHSKLLRVGTSVAVRSLPSHPEQVVIDWLATAHHLGARCVAAYET